MVHKFLQREVLFRSILRNEKGGASLITVFALIGLVGLIGYRLNRMSVMSDVMGNTVHQKEAATYIAEAGILHSLWEIRKNRAWVAGFTEVPFGDGHYSVTATGNPDGSTSLVSTGVSDGSKDTLKKRISLPCDGSMSFMASDTHLEAGSPASNYDENTSLLVQAQQNPAFLYFDLSAFPSMAQVNAAEISLYLHSTSANDTVTLFSVTNEWTASEATWIKRTATENWTTSGGDYDSQAVGTLTSAISGWKQADLSPLVEGWVDGTTPNNGVILKDNAGQDQFYSSQYSDPALRPKLTVQYSFCG